MCRHTKKDTDTSVYVLFPGTQKCVPARTFLLFSVYEFLRRLSYINEPDMHVLCFVCFDVAPGFARGFCSDAHPSHPPHIATHHILNIRSIFDGLVCRRACQRRDGSCKKISIYCAFLRRRRRRHPHPRC